MKTRASRERRAPSATIWTARSIQSGYEWSGRLVAYWEVERDPVCDDYTSQEMRATELLRRWAHKVSPDHPDGLVPI